MSKFDKYCEISLEVASEEGETGSRQRKKRQSPSIAQRGASTSNDPATKSKDQSATNLLKKLVKLREEISRQDGLYKEEPRKMNENSIAAQAEVRQDGLGNLGEGIDERPMSISEPVSSLEKQIKHLHLSRPIPTHMQHAIPDSHWHVQRVRPKLDPVTLKEAVWLFKTELIPGWWAVMHVAEIAAIRGKFYMIGRVTPAEKKDYRFSKLPAMWLRVTTEGLELSSAGLSNKMVLLSYERAWRYQEIPVTESSSGMS
ncbi:hypothetical protein N7488_008553 [Penicillium malachiteum]|nr:hypothetical protein N7488_008553 [Penicillium malachiteum]